MGELKGSRYANHRIMTSMPILSLSTVCSSPMVQVTPLWSRKRSQTYRRRFEIAKYLSLASASDTSSSLSHLALPHGR